MNLAKKKKHAKKLDVSNSKHFYSNSKKNTGVSFASYSFPMGTYSIDLYNNATQLGFFLTQHCCDMV